METLYEDYIFDNSYYDETGCLYITRMFDYPVRVTIVDVPYMFNDKLITQYAEVVPFVGY